MYDKIKKHSDESGYGIVFPDGMSKKHTLFECRKELSRDTLADVAQFMLMKTIVGDIYGPEEAENLNKRIHEDPDGVGDIAEVTEILAMMLAADMKGEKTSFEMARKELYDE